MPIINLEELVGHTFGITSPDGQVDKVENVEAIKKHTAHTRGSPTHIQFKCSVNDNAHEEVMSYNNIMSHLERDEHTKVMRKFKNILAHHGHLVKATQIIMAQHTTLPWSGKIGR